MRGLEIGSVDGVAISSVVPPLDSMLRQVCEVLFRGEAAVYRAGREDGAAGADGQSGEVGADRIVNCVAAFERFGGPTIVVDMGTATTFDVISKKGEFMGGAIAPGLGISAEALFSKAARLPRIDIKKPAKVIGTGTVDNIQIGLVLRLYRAGGWDSGADDRGAGAGDEDGCYGWAGEADRGGLEVHRRGG